MYYHAKRDRLVCKTGSPNFVKCSSEYLRAGSVASISSRQRPSLQTLGFNKSQLLAFKDLAAVVDLQSKGVHTRRPLAKRLFAERL
jgi:hypothetical protein